MALVLAIAPAFTHHDVLQRLADDLAAHEIVFAPSRDEALAVISRRIPDLVVFPVRCSEADEARIAARVRDLSGAGDPRALAIPLLAFTVAETSAFPTRWFYWFKPRGETTWPEHRDWSRAFAEQIRDYLATEPADLSVGLIREDSPWVWDSLAGRVAAAVPAAARAILARLSELRIPPCLVWRPRISPPGWRRSVGAALLLTAAVTTAAGLTRRAEWFTATPERAPAAARRQPRTPGAGTSADRKKMSATRKTGRLRVTSNPVGATVAIDGRTRGVTPLVLDDLPAGRHNVTLESAGGTVRHSVEVKADQTATVEGSIYPGWLALFAPIELEARADGRVLRFDEQHQTLLPPGRHEIMLVSHELGYHASRVVDVKPGEITTLSIVPPRTTLTVAATAPAEVWLDGVRIGAAPVIDVPIDLGTHEVVVRHATAGEERRTIAATSAPVRVEIDFGNQD